MCLQAHKLHHGKHHVKHHGHSHGHVHHVMHTVKDTLKRFALMLGLRHKGCGKHAKGQLKHHPEVSPVSNVPTADALTGRPPGTGILQHPVQDQGLAHRPMGPTATASAAGFL